MNKSNNGCIFSLILRYWKKEKLLKNIYLIAAGIMIAAILIIILLPRQNMVPLIAVPIHVKEDHDKIILRINQEGITSFVTEAGLITVADKYTARRMRFILISEDLMPKYIEPWHIFNIREWTITDVIINKMFRRNITKILSDHIKTSDDVDNANVFLLESSNRWFRGGIIGAIISITPNQESDILQNTEKINSIKKLVKSAFYRMNDERIIVREWKR
ncbi:MAG: hypothetical protein FWD40_07570 [Treponema sp.]|nr:hypothetical protein [Treponema sp.]